jgi:DegV family protein with EDD domain
MDQNLRNAFVCGYERLVSWADLLDQINVFPVADSDTGCNLRISLAPLREFNGNAESTIRSLLASATGNSGNIGAGFFSGFLVANSPEDLLRSAKDGRDKAWQAIGDPKIGTILTVFDELARTLESGPVGQNRESVSRLIDNLQEAVWSTSELLPELKRAGVVDAGALGMFIYMEGFFRRLVCQTDTFRPITALFSGKLRISSSYEPELVDSCCVDSVIRVDGRSENAVEELSKYGESVVAVRDGSYLKIHLHTDNSQEVRNKLESFGDVVQWTDDNIGTRVGAIASSSVLHQAIHVMTDAAGSVSRETARELGMTLLDSYVIVGDKSVPETLLSTSELYAQMRRGAKVSTAQASTFERNQAYQSVLDRYGNVLYLCVGSVFTGNYNAVMAWKGENDPDDRLTVIDSEAASGRLGTIAIATARYSNRVKDADEVMRFAKEAVRKCEEYVFLDRLKYLAAGGRLSKTGGFFGDLLHMKPVISPTAQGARQVGVARNRDGQLEFALERLKRRLGHDSSPLIVLEYSDNQAWVNNTARKKVQRRYPLADIVLQPLSLTSGVHMGPGTWAVAFLPECQ